MQGVHWLILDGCIQWQHCQKTSTLVELPRLGARGCEARPCWASYILYTVSCSIVQNQTYLILAGGHMSREALRMLPGSSNGLVRKYIDKAGKRRHVGVPSRLKGSQRLVEIIACQLITLESALCVSRCSSC